MQFSDSERKYLSVSISILVLFVVEFWAFAASVAAHKLIRFDTTVIAGVQSRIDPTNTRVMKFFTFVGSPTIVAILVVLFAVILYWKGKRWEALAVIVANAGGSLFNHLLKVIFHRQRPDIHRIISAHGYSFPSGHSFGSVVFYGVLSYFVCLFAKSALTKVATCIGAILFIIVIGLSRVYLGVHYPSDVIAGYAAGGAWLLVCITCMHLFVRDRNVRNTAAGG